MNRAWVPLLLMLSACAATPDAEVGTVGEVADVRKRAQVHTELARLYLERGQAAIALEELRVALAADPGYGPAYTVRGLVRSGLNDPAGARDDFERAIVEAPDDPEANHQYGWFLCQRGEVAESGRYLLKAARDPRSQAPSRSYALAGVCALRDKDAKSAEEHFVSALRFDPDDATSLLQLAHLRYRQRSLEDARRLIVRFNRVVDPSAESLWLALRIERRLGERAAEAGLASQLRRRFPTSREYQALQRGDFE